MAGNPTGNAITNEIMYMANLLGRGQMPYAGAFQGATGALQGAASFLNRNQIGTRGIPAKRPPMPGLPVDYKQTELAAGAAAEAFRPGAGFPGQQAERAYQSNKAAVAQQVAQDPALSQYERDRAAAVASGDQAKMDAVRDQGMAIWAAKYGGPDGLASKVKPGQSGYETIQKTLYPGGAPLPAMSAESEAMLNAIAPPDATGVRPNVTPMPGQLPAFGNASEAMFQAVTGGGAYITPMPKEAVTPQTQAQDLAEGYRQAMLARIPTNK